METATHHFKGRKFEGSVRPLDPHRMSCTRCTYYQQHAIHVTDFGTKYPACDCNGCTKTDQELEDLPPWWNRHNGREMSVSPDAISQTRYCYECDSIVCICALDES